MQAYHVIKTKFDERATKWLKETDTSEKEIQNAISSVRVLRS